METQASAADEVIILCLEESETLVEPMCSSKELQQDLVPYVLSHSLQNPSFLKLKKADRQIRVKALTQLLLGGEFSGQGVEAGGDSARAASEISPWRFWAHLRAKYGTRQRHMQHFLKLMEPHLRPRRVVVLRFEGEVAVPAVSLLVRSSAPCSSVAAEQCVNARQMFEAHTFDASALCSALSAEDSKGPKSTRPPPLWPQLMAECRRYGKARVQAFILCTEAQSTDTAPEALELAARSLHMDCEAIPYLSSVAFGPQSSEHLAALEELCAWAGGLSLNVSDPDSLQPVSEGLSAHVFGGRGQQPGLSERREFYARKQALGTRSCFLQLPTLAGPSHDATSSSQRATGIIRVLGAGNGFNFDGSLPSEAMLAVLSDVSMALQRRWAASLRCWRMYRGLRDVVFSEPGNIGLEFDEPQLSANDPARRSWRLRATHPPASSLKMEEQSELVAINLVRVNSLTPRSEVARRIAARPVSLTFRSPGGGNASVEATLPFGGAMLAMATAEVVVGELREGLPPLKKAAPPLSTSLKHIAETKAANKAAGGPCKLQAGRLLQVVAGWDEVAADGSPSWLQHVSDHDASNARMRLASTADVLSTVPSLLFCSLLYCGDVLSLARAGMVCCRWRWLVLDGARTVKEDCGSRHSQRLLWRWVLRWGVGPTSAQRTGFWRWVLAISQKSADSGAVVDSASNASSVLESAIQNDAAGLLEISMGLGGGSVGVQLAATLVGRLSSVMNGLPSDILRALLEEPFCLQRSWLLTSSGLPWLVHQGRCFQVALAAHHPNIFQHSFAEGVAPELFYCLWSQSLLQGLVGNTETLRLWDLFVFERSQKVLIRTAVALFILLEKQILGKNDDKIMKALFNPESWQLEEGALLEKSLNTKVTRSMLQVIAETSVPGANVW